MHPNWPGGPPAGWYPDPSGQRAWRWWDGQRWTEHASDPAGPGAAGAAGGSWSPTGSVHPLGPLALPSVHERFAAELRAAPWARRGLLAYLALVAVGALVAWGESSQFRQLFHDLRIQSETGVAQPRPPLDLNLYSMVNLVLSALFYVPFLIWQFQAAKTARLLYLPARLSAGLGVGGWFIPVVNLWFPYQAIRDCLAPDDPGRRTVARLWAAWLATAVANLATVALALAGSPVGFVLVAVSMALAATFLAEARRAVDLIAEAHRRLLTPGPGPG